MALSAVDRYTCYIDMGGVATFVPSRKKASDLSEHDGNKENMVTHNFNDPEGPSNLEVLGNGMYRCVQVVNKYDPSEIHSKKFINAKKFLELINIATKCGFVFTLISVLSVISSIVVMNMTTDDKIHVVAEVALYSSIGGFALNLLAVACAHIGGTPEEVYVEQVERREAAHERNEQQKTNVKKDQLSVEY